MPCSSRATITRVSADTLWCSRCRSHVLDLSALDEAGARDVVRRLEGARACITYRTHRDGTVRFSARAVGLTPVLVLALACARASTAGVGTPREPPVTDMAVETETGAVPSDTSTARDALLAGPLPPDMPDAGTQAAHALVGSQAAASRAPGLGHIGNFVGHDPTLSPNRSR